MIYVIPISSFSKKIITTHRAEPVSINARDILYQTFNNIRTGRPVSMLEADKLLNDSIEIQITGTLRRSEQPYLYQAGINIHRLHLHEMMLFIEGQVMGGGNASAAIRQYFEIFDIDDEDMNMESIFRKWQRYWSDKKILKKSFKKTAKKEHHKRTKIETVSIAEFYSQMAWLVYDNLQYFTTTDGKFKVKLLRHLKIYLYHKVLKYDIGNCARIFGFTTRHIYNAINNIENIMRYDHRLGQHIEEILSLQYEAA